MSMRYGVAFGLLWSALAPAVASGQEWPVTINPHYTGTVDPLAAPAVVEGFGKKGTLALTSDMRFVIEYLTTLPAADVSSTSHLEVLFTPAVVYFPINHFSVGLMGIYVYNGTKGIERTALGGAPVLGVNIWMAGKRLSLYPQLAVPYVVDSWKNYPTVTSLGLDATAPFLWHLAPHLFLGVGPAFRLDLVRKADGIDLDKMRMLGARLIIGGYL